MEEGTSKGARKLSSTFRICHGVTRGTKKYELAPAAAAAAGPAAVCTTGVCSLQTAH